MEDADRTALRTPGARRQSQVRLGPCLWDVSYLEWPAALNRRPGLHPNRSQSSLHSSLLPRGCSMSSICQPSSRPGSCTHTSTHGGGGVTSPNLQSRLVLAVTPSRQLVGPSLSWPTASLLLFASHAARRPHCVTVHSRPRRKKNIGSCFDRAIWGEMICEVPKRVLADSMRQQEISISPVTGRE